MFFLNLNIAGCDKKIPIHCLLLFCKITTRVVTNQIHHAYAFYIYIYIQCAWKYALETHSCRKFPNVHN